MLLVYAAKLITVGTYFFKYIFSFVSAKMVSENSVVAKVGLEYLNLISYNL